LGGRLSASILRQFGENSVSSFISRLFIEKVKKIFPVLTHALLALLFAGSLLMAAANTKDFQFWFSLAITVLLAWIALKK
jgi:cation transport ATPase